VSGTRQASETVREDKPMLDDLRIGDRVRVTERYREVNYPAGEKGKVLDGPKTSSVSGAIYYIVAMDKDIASRRTVFLADEIEDEVKEKEGRD
jgi:hypothetical protein